MTFVKKYVGGFFNSEIVFMESKIFKHRLRVRYAETDQMGVVYYANYFVWFEAARTDFLRTIGMPYKSLEQQGIFLPVVEAYARYIAPAFYEDEIVVEIQLKEIKSASLKIFYNVKRCSDNKLLVEGYTKHTVINKNGKIKRMPDNLRERLNEYLC